MHKKITAFILAAVLFVSCLPLCSYAADAQLGFRVSPDEQVGALVNVSLNVKCNESVEADGVYAYFTYNPAVLTLVDSENHAVIPENFSSGVTFRLNNKNVVKCAAGWSDDSSFVKRIGDDYLVGLEIAPDSETDVSDGIYAANVKLKITAGTYTGFDKSALVPVRQKTGELPFAAAVYTSGTKVEVAPFVEYTEEFNRLVCTHDWTGPFDTAPRNGSDGEAYYICSSCGLKNAVKFDNNEYSPFAVKSVLPGDLSENNFTPIVASKANNFILKQGNNTVCDYSLRGASVRCTQADGSGFTDLRFTASIQLPVPPESAPQSVKDSYELKDFGFVYTLSESILKEGENTADENTEKLDVSRLTRDGIDGSYGINSSGVNCAVLSYKDYSDDGKNFYFSTFNSASEYTGSSYNANADFSTAKFITFNIVIKVNELNYDRFYAVRPYITYKYLGKEYTLYDTDGAADVCSSRSVLYVARKAYGSATEPQQMKEYLYNNIISLYP